MLGSCNILTCCGMQVNKHELVAHLGIPFRDLRILDPSIPTPSPSSVFIRENAIIFNIESLRMIITKDEVSCFRHC